MNVGVFSPRAFRLRKPRALETWRSVATSSRVEFSKRDYFERATWVLARQEFLVRGTLPRPALSGSW